MLHSESTIKQHIFFGNVHGFPRAPHNCPVLNLLFVPNKIDCVLPRWRDNLLSISQLLTYSSSELNVDSISATFFPEAIKAESSAYNNSLHLTADAISFTYNKNKRGPSMDMHKAMLLLVVLIIFMCSDNVKVTIFRSYCSSLYTSQLWWKYKVNSIRKLYVAYNNDIHVTP